MKSTASSLDIAHKYKGRAIRSSYITRWKTYRGVNCAHDLLLHVRRNLQLKKNGIGLKDNETKTILTLSAQAELMQVIYSSFFRVYDEILAPTLPVPTAVMPV